MTNCPSTPSGSSLAGFLYAGCASSPPLKRKKPAEALSSAGFVGPGSYLLSRGLSPDYHRRADVSLPGSGWGWVEPSGCDHQASLGFLCSFRGLGIPSLAALRLSGGLSCCLSFSFCGFVSFAPCLSGRLASAWLLSLLSVSFSNQASFPKLSARGLWLSP